MKKDVIEYIKKQKSPQKAILTKLRKIILKTYPKITEGVFAGVPCYGVNEKNKYGVIYLVGLRDHVNMGFCLKGMSKKDQDLLEGSGKTMRHLKFFTLKDIDEKKIVKLLKAVKK